MERSAADFTEFAFPEFERGTVWLVGAGPGDPGLLTLLGRHALEQADVIVYDALVDRRLLGFARADCRLDDVGKRGGRPSPRQPEISARLVELAQAGLRVLRLKGGDPFVFGRGGEEAQVLAEAGIPFRIVPGVTAGIGGPAYAGIPVTHRDANHAVAFVTGHDASGGMPESVNWSALARGAPVLVLYMAARQLGAIASRLVAEGRDPAEPVAVVSRATTPEQEVRHLTLAQAAAEPPPNEAIAPAVIVIGPVVRLSETLNWWRPPGDASGPAAPGFSAPDRSGAST